MLWAWRSEHSFMDWALFPLCVASGTLTRLPGRKGSSFPAESSLTSPPPSSLQLNKCSCSDIHPTFTFFQLSPKSLHSILSKYESNPGPDFAYRVLVSKSTPIGRVYYHGDDLISWICALTGCHAVSLPTAFLESVGQAKSRGLVPTKHSRLVNIIGMMYNFLVCLCAGTLPMRVSMRAHVCTGQGTCSSGAVVLGFRFVLFCFEMASPNGIGLTK